MTAIESIKQNTGIMEMAAKFVEIDQRHGKATCNCPNCENDTGKHLTLYADSNRFYCFKCQAKGDQIDLYRLFTGRDTKGAISELASPGQQQTPVPQAQPQKRHNMEAESQPRDFSQLYLEIIADNSPICPLGKEYLNNRGIPDKIINKYNILCIEDPKLFAKSLLAKYELEDLVNAGLFDYSKNGKPYCTFFMPAILFPHWALDFNSVKYYSSRNRAGETKSFKLHNVRTQPYPGQTAQDSKQIFIFEGIINGLSYEILTNKDNWLALGGLITPERYNKLATQFPNQKLILGLDPDEAGKQALGQIESCTYINWKAFAQELGFKGLQYDSNGKAWDLNDYLVNRR